MKTGMGIRPVLIAAATVLCGHGLAAQDIPEPASLERRMNLMVIDAVTELEQASDVVDGTAARTFLRLFENEDTPVFCDLYSSDDFLSTVPVREYAGSFLGKDDTGKFTALTYEFKDIRKLGWRFGDGRWYCTVELKKSLNYFDGNLVYYPLSVQNPGGDDFVLRVELVFDETCSGCRISGISCSNARDFRSAGSGYLVIQRNEDPDDARRDDGIMVKGSKVVYNDFGQGYAPKGDISFWDEDMKVTAVSMASSDLYDYVRFKYKPRHLRLRLRNEFAPVSAYSFSGTADLASRSSSAYSVGIDVGYSVTASRGFRIGFYTGIGVTFSRISLQTAPFSYSYRITDRDTGMDYSRNYDIGYASQGAEFTDLAVPLYLSPEFRLHKAVSLVLDLGVKFYANTGGSTDPFHVRGSVQGIYEDGTGIPDGKYGTGNIDADFREMVSAVTFQRSPFDVCLAGNVGLDVNLYNRMLYLQVKAGYEYGLTWSYRSPEYEFCSETGGIYPLVYSVDYGRDVAFRPLADCVSFRRQSWWFGIGLMLKL